MGTASLPVATLATPLAEFAPPLTRTGGARATHSWPAMNGKARKKMGLWLLLIAATFALVTIVASMMRDMASGTSSSQRIKMDCQIGSDNISPWFMIVVSGKVRKGEVLTLLYSYSTDADSRRIAYVDKDSMSSGKMVYYHRYIEVNENFKHCTFTLKNDFTNEVVATVKIEFPKSP